MKKQAVILLHEIYGMNQFMQETSQKLERIGYHASGII